jgi:hypothetical protein
MIPYKYQTRCSFVIEFIITKFIEGSTCFERHTAHHQELYTVFAAWEIPFSLDNGRTPHGYINQRLQIQFRALDDERYAARNMLSLQ